MNPAPEQRQEIPAVKVSSDIYIHVFRLVSRYRVSNEAWHLPGYCQTTELWYRFKVLAILAKFISGHFQYM